MVGIKIRNQFIDLFPDTAIEFEFDHPIGLIIDSVDEIKSGYSIPIDIPIDGLNASIIGRVDRLDLEGVLMQNEYCEIWIEGILLYLGKATIKGATNTRATLFIIFNELKELADINMAEVDYGGDRMIGADTATRLAHAKATATNPLDYDYVFCPILNPKYFNDVNPLFSTQNFQNFWSFVTDNFVENNGGVAMPFIRFDYLLTRIFKELGYTLDNQWQTTDELKKLLLWNNYNIYADLNTWADTINLANHVPYRSAIDFVKAIVGTYGLGLFPDPHTKTFELIPFRDLILAPEVADWTSKAAASYGHETNRDYVSRFRFDVDTSDDLSVQYSGVTFPQGAVLGEGLTARSMNAASEYFLRFAYGDNTYYFIPITNITEGFHATYIFQDQKEVNKGGTDKEVISQIIPLWNSWALHKDGVIETGDDLPFQEWMVPHIQHIGFDNNITIVKTPVTSFRAMLYRGFQPCDTGISGTYPMASTTRYNIRGEVVGEHSLLWDREDGIYNKFWKLPFEMLKSKKSVKRKMNLTIADLLSFKFKNKYRIENQNYFFRKLRFSASAKGLSQIEVDMITTL